MTGFFGAVDERVWSALLVKTRESSLDLRFPLCQSDQNEAPVSLFFFSLFLSSFFSVDFGSASSSSSVWPQIPTIWAPLPCSLYTCRIITGYKQTKQNIYFSRRICAIAVALAVRSAHGVSPLSLPLNSFRSSGSVWLFLERFICRIRRMTLIQCVPYLSGRPAPLRLRFNTPVFVLLPSVACF